MITKDEIKGIFRDIVRYYPEIGCSKLNTFFVIDDGSEFETENLKAQYSDYLKGDFWSRNWVVGGADPERLCKEYPILGIEQKRLYGNDIDEKLFCWEYWVTIVDTPECGDCNDCNRSIDEVDRDLFNNALIVLRELLKYNKYSVTKDGETSDVWATLNQINYWQVNGFIDSYLDLCEPLEMLVNGGSFDSRGSSTGLDVRSFGLGLTDNARAVSFVLQFCDCVDEQPQFNYDFRASAEIGIVKCPTCLPLVPPPPPAPICQTLELTEGANWVSFSVLPEDVTPASFFDSLITAGNLVFVQGRNNLGNVVTFIPGFPSVLTEIKRGFGYVIEVNEDVTFEVCGNLQDPFYNKALVSGQNIVWFVRTDQVYTPQQYFAQLITDGVLIEVTTIVNGVTLTFIPNGINELGTMEFGRAYNVRTNSAVPENGW